jgi:hypothetical protein
MFGKHRKGITYYCCQPEANNRGRPDAYAGHPKTAYVREDLLLDALAAFYTDHVLRPERPDLLTAALERARHHTTSQRQTEQDRLHLLLNDVARRQHNLLQQAQNALPKTLTPPPCATPTTTWKSNGPTPSEPSARLFLPRQPIPPPSFLRPSPT